MAVLVHKETLKSILLLFTHKPIPKISEEHTSPLFGFVSQLQKVDLMFPGCIGYIKNVEQVAPIDRLEKFIKLCGIIVFPQYVTIINFSKLTPIRDTHALIVLDASFASTFQKVFKNASPPSFTFSSIKGISEIIPILNSVSAEINIVPQLEIKEEESQQKNKTPTALIDIDETEDQDIPVVHDESFLIKHFISHGIDPLQLENIRSIILNKKKLVYFQSSLPHDCKHCTEFKYLSNLIHADDVPEEAEIYTLMDKTIDFLRHMRDTNEEYESYSESEVIHEGDILIEQQEVEVENLSKEVEEMTLKDFAEVEIQATTNQELAAKFADFVPFWKHLEDNKDGQYYGVMHDYIYVPKWNEMVRPSELIKYPIDHNGVSMKDYYRMVFGQVYVPFH